MQGHGNNSDSMMELERHGEGGNHNWAQREDEAQRGRMALAAALEAADVQRQREIEARKQALDREILRVKRAAETLRRRNDPSTIHTVKACIKQLIAHQGFIWPIGPADSPGRGGRDFLADFFFGNTVLDADHKLFHGVDLADIDERAGRTITGLTAYAHSGDGQVDPDSVDSDEKLIGAALLRKRAAGALAYMKVYRTDMGEGDRLFCLAADRGEHPELVETESPTTQQHVYEHVLKF